MIPIERFNKPLDVKDWLIEDERYNKLNKLKKSNPEAFFYWYKASLSFIPKGPVFSNMMLINDKNPIKSRKKPINSGTFSGQDIKSLEDAIYWSGVREVNFIDEVIVSSIKDKFDNKNYRVKAFNQVELSLILKTIDENITFMNKYKYDSLTNEQEISYKQIFLMPLFKLREKVK